MNNDRLRVIDSRLHMLGHLYHAYLKSGREDLAAKAIDLLHDMEAELADKPVADPKVALN